MIDEIFIHVKSGNGGNGCISGRREKFVPRGGPDGGDGGTGGSVFLQSDVNVNTLLEYRYKRHFEAEDGGDGAGAKKHGKDGIDIVLPVPVGTQVWTIEDTPRLLADLSRSNQRVCVASGGRGGRGNARFANSVTQFPLLAEAGEEAEEVPIRLELKLLADVGIIGKPNAGKSSLLAATSAAKPKVADYPFTTLEPVLGVVEHRDESFVMVDIPGLIEGASAGIGLGHDFLRHVERTRVLIHLLDGSSDDPIGDYHQINKELALHNKELMDKPQVIAINKIDLPDVRDYIELFKERFALEGREVFFISAATTENVDRLFDEVVRVLHERRPVIARDSEESEEIPVLRPTPRRERARVIREDERTFVVIAPTAERIGKMIDQSDWAARMQYYSYLKRSRVISALEAAGVLPGDTVRIGDVEWDWE
jgi:GTP-binding protein